MKNKIGSICNYLAGIILLVMGMVYLLKGTVMPYHLTALEKEWVEIEPNAQILLLALMRAVAGGFIALAIAILYLQKQFVHTKSPWMPGLILLMGLVVSAGAMYATLLVKFNTPATPPTGLAALGMILLLFGYLFNLK